MSALIRAELLKLRTTRTALGYAAAATILTLVFIIITITSSDLRTVGDERNALAVGSGLSAVLLLFGVVGSAAEYRHHTLAPALLAVPGRARLLVARMIAYGVAGFLIGVLMLIVGLAIGIPLIAGEPAPSLAGSDYVHLVAGGLLATTLCAMLGVAIGALVANQVAAVVGVIVWLFILEPLLAPLLHRASAYTISQTATALGGGTDGELLAWGAALAVLAVWAAAFMVSASFVDARRDV
jgi:ABC-2 type transport system permease protein